MFTKLLSNQHYVLRDVSLVGGSVAMKYYIFILLFLRSVTSEKSWSEDKSDVVHLNSKNFQQIIENRDSVLVAFYAPWCPHCKSFKPELEGAAEVLARKQPLFAAVDATVEKDLANEHDVKGFPTLKYFKNGNFAWNLELREKDDLVYFMNNPVDPSIVEEDWYSDKNPVTHVGPDNFDTTVAKTDHALVIFYVDWCPHCKNAKPKFMKAAQKFRDKKGYGFFAIHCEKHEDLCQKRFNAFWLPTFIYFRKGKKVVKYFENHETDAFVDFMNDAPKHMDYIEFWKWPKPILILTEDNFNSTLEKLPKTLVSFYAPWCAHCQQMKTVYIEAAKKAQDDGEDVVFAVIDCVEEQVACNRRKINFFPTFRVYEGKEPVADYNGDSTVDGFLKAWKTAWKWEKPVIQLDKEKLKTVLKDYEKSIVMYYAPWCGHCETAKPAFLQAAKDKKSDAKLLYAAVDCETQGRFCSENGIKTYPTFLIYSKGVYENKYEGKRNVQGFREALGSKKSEL